MSKSVKQGAMQLVARQMRDWVADHSELSRNILLKWQNINTKLFNVFQNYFSVCT